MIRHAMVLWVIANYKKNTMDLSNVPWEDYQRGEAPQHLCRIKFRTREDAIKFVGRIQDEVSKNFFGPSDSSEYVFIEIRGFAEFLGATPEGIREEWIQKLK